MYLGEYLSVSAYACTDGNDPKLDFKKLREGVQIVVGTPRKVLDLVKKGILTLYYLKLFILSQVDEMLQKRLKE